MLKVKNYIRSLTPFLGVSPDRLIPLIEKVRLEFKNFDKGDSILYPGMKADNLYLLLSGPVVIEQEPFDEVRVSWRIPEGHPIDLPAMFGLSQHHELSARAEGPVRVVSIDKLQFRKMYESDPIILINLINSLGLAASTPPSVDGEDVVELWIKSVDRMASHSPSRIDVKLKRLGEILSMSVEVLKSRLRACERRGLINWLPDEEAMIVLNRI